MLRSVVAWPGVRTRGSVRGASPSVNGAAADHAAGLSHWLRRSSQLPLVVGSTPATTFGRCVLPNRPELLVACQMESGNPSWYLPARVSDQPPSSAFVTPPPVSQRRPSPNGSSTVALTFRRCGTSSSEYPY